MAKVIERNSSVFPEPSGEGNFSDGLAYGLAESSGGAGREYDDLDSERRRVLAAQNGEAFEYRFLSDPLMRMQYVQLTSQLVDTLLKNDIETIVFLDKSARPVRWLMRQLWPLLAGNHDLNNPSIPPMPKSQFLNIDRGMWRKKTGSMEDPTGVGVQVNQRTVGRDIADLRAAHLIRHTDVETQGGEFEKRSFLDNQNMLVVDEVKSSGDTLEIARKFMEQAFPSSKIFAEHWMTGTITTKEGTRTNKDLPIWYKEDTALGRGIGDINPAGNEQDDNARIRRGKNFFSRTLKEHDESSQALWNDFKVLIQEILWGKLPLRLNMVGLEPDELDRRLQFMEFANGDVTAKEVAQILDVAQRAPDDKNRLLKLYSLARERLTPKTDSTTT